MFEELREAPQVVARALQHDHQVYAEVVRALDARAASAWLTIARGSSDHASAYLAYLVMARLGRIVTTLPLSLLTLYHAPIRGRDVAAFAFSQSGASPDLVLPTRQLRQGGACTVAFVNEMQSDLARAAEWAIDLRAGAERSVAATKSFIAQLLAGARLVQLLLDDAGFSEALQRLPDDLDVALRQDWSPALDVLREAQGLYVIGRGIGLPIAQEAALKFKETCGLHAEAFSGAEVQHGPMALARPEHPLLIFAPAGPAQQDLLALAANMRARGVVVLLAAPVGTVGANLSLAPASHEDLSPMLTIQSFYAFVERLSRERGFDPDAPPHLSKVTRTH
ncbi:SIS domain-containing protein [Polaromonas sp.]|uniref:SIS domain-containing protein n=1 Tax=Polaromonas sp. TaxID=1869339 RepID=UPI002FC79060